jgi:3-phenylpropionate/cinnamic acid dioxygenase small subunit
VRDGGLVTAVAQFLYDEAALLDEWLALFHPKAAEYVIPSPEDLSDDSATILQLVNDSMTTLAGRIDRRRRQS